MGGIRIDLKKGIYSPGEEINGLVHVLLEKTVSQRSATLSLIGKEKTRVTYQSGENSCTAVEESAFLHQEVSLPLPIADKGKIGPGNYNVPFRFMLPQGLPVTYKGRNVKIIYELRARIDIPLGFDIRQSSEFVVISNPPSFPSIPIDIRSYSWNDPNIPGISLTLERCEYGRGEFLSGRCAFRNPRSKNLRKIDVVLKWIEAAKARGHRKRTELAKQVAQVALRGRVLKGESPFRIQIPQEAPPTFEASLCSVRCILHVGLDIALGHDVAADQAIRVVGSEGEGKIPSSYNADRWSSTAKNIPEKAYQPEYADHAPTQTWCYNCGAPIGVPDATYCPNCGSRLRMLAEDTAPPVIRRKAEINGRTTPTYGGVEGCMVCHRSLSQRDDVVWCPHCGKLAHRVHILEWIAGKKSCPACGKSLNEDDYE